MLPFFTLNRAQIKAPSQPQTGTGGPMEKLAIHWSLAAVQRVMALGDTVAECSLVYGKPEQFPVPSAYTDGCGGQMM